MADHKLLARLRRAKMMSTDQQKQQLENYYKARGYAAQDVATAIIGAGLANAIAFLALTGTFTIWNTIVGFIILCILQAYHPAPFSRISLKVAYAAIWSISFLSTFGVVFDIAFVSLGGSFPKPDADCVIPFPSPSLEQRLCNHHSSSTHFTVFTPINLYDLSFFASWIVLSIICYLVFVKLTRSS